MVASEASFEATICSGGGQENHFNQNNYSKNYGQKSSTTIMIQTSTIPRYYSTSVSNLQKQNSTRHIDNFNNASLSKSAPTNESESLRMSSRYQSSSTTLSPSSFVSRQINYKSWISLIQSSSSSKSVHNIHILDKNIEDNNNHYQNEQHPKFKTLKTKKKRRRKFFLQKNIDNKDQENDYQEIEIVEDWSSKFNHDRCDRGLIEPSAIIRFLCYFSYVILIIFGYCRMFMEWIKLGNYNAIVEKNRKEYRPLYNSWQAFFTRYIYRRVADIFSIPITGNPGGMVTVLDRHSMDHNFTFKLTGGRYQCINLASYDYLGFSKQSSKDPAIEAAIRKYGVGVNAIHELGMLDLHRRLEIMFAKFLQVESCIVFGMGFATNSTNIPSLADDGCLILADQRSHASAKSGIYLSQATFQYFKHNDCDDLEQKIRLAILKGNPKFDSRPWKKIIIIVEGVYSMEGTIVDLPRLIQLKRRYKCYLYVDEAHSIGAVGPHGRGIVDYFGCDPNDVDLLMGTMTKSFAAAGGYLAGKKSLIDHIRRNSMSNYAGSISAPIIQQIINTVSILSDQNTTNSEGCRRIAQLLSNTHYMRDALKRLGFVITGHYDSPVIPIMIYLPAKIGSIVRMAVRNGLALVCAGYPATSLTTNRIRLCMTAEHSRETLDQAIRILSMIGDVHHIKYQRYGVL